MVDIPRMEYDDIDFGSSSYNKVMGKFGQSVTGLKWGKELDNILGLRAAPLSQKIIALLGVNKLYTLEQVKGVLEHIQEEKIQAIIPYGLQDDHILSYEFETMIANSKQYYDVTQGLKDVLQFQELQDKVNKRKNTTLIDDVLFTYKMKGLFSHHSSIWTHLNTLYRLYPLAKSDIYSLLRAVFVRDDINDSEKKNIIKNIVTSSVPTIYMLAYDYPEYHNHIIDRAQEFYHMTPIEDMSISAIEDILQELIDNKQYQNNNSIGGVKK